MSKLEIMVNGAAVPLEELQADVTAAKRKGFNHDYAFTVHTVQGLIDKINELTIESEKVPDTTLS